MNSEVMCSMFISTDLKLKRKKNILETKENKIFATLSAIITKLLSYFTSTGKNKSKFNLILKKMVN